MQKKRQKRVKALALLSGGLDSMLAIKLMQRQPKLIIEAVYFKLPFISPLAYSYAAKFTEKEKLKLHIIDCTKGKSLQEYLKIIKKPKYGYGSAINPCIDCRIFMLKKTKQIMKKIKADFIATGEVLNERPMSQTKHALMLIEKESGLKGKILRPLSAKLLPETKVEKQGLVAREKFLDIQGRQRKRQMALAKRYKLKYPTPAGGCLLCEKAFAAKLRDLFKYQKKINSRDIELLKLGRHFRYNKNKIVVGRNEQENKLLMRLAENDIMLEVKDFPGPITLLQGKTDKQTIKVAAALTVSHSDARHEKNIEVNYGKRKLNKVLKINGLSKNKIEKLRI